MEISDFLPLFLGLGLLLGFSAFFSGSETALCALSKVQIERLRSEAKASSRAIVAFVDDPRRLFITILLGNVIVNIAFSTLTAALIYALFAGTAEVAGASGMAVVVATLAITIFLLIFGEITPKTYAIQHAEAFARVTARLLWGFSVVITPARALLRWITSVLIPLFGGGGISQEDHVTADDFRAALALREEGALQRDERQMLDNILQLRDIDANEIMVPRTEMIAMPTSSTVEEVLARAKEVGFSRIPIYRDRIDDLLGIFHIKDLPLWSHLDLRSWTLEEFLAKRHEVASKHLENTLVRPPFFVFETKKLTDLFAELTRHRTKIAILLDEYGGVAGAVTIEDIIEEIVGDILDEHDHAPRAPEISPDPENPSRIRLSGRVSVREINHRFRLKIDDAIADTMGGYVLSLFGRVPSTGESTADATGTRFEVVATRGHSITELTMTLPELGGENGSGS